MYQIIKTLRVKHWSKNLLIFLIPLLSGNLDKNYMTYYIIYFLTFSLFVSGTYILNDLIDIENDKLHPTKKFRPIASGELKKKDARYIFIIISLGTMFVAFMINRILLNFLFLYLLSSILYSLFFKYIKYFDLFYLTLFFILRVVLGSYLFDVQFTTIFIMFIFFSTATVSIAKKYSILNTETSRDTKIKKTIASNYKKEKLFNIFILFILISNIIFGIWIFNQTFISIYLMKIFLYLIMSFILFNFYKYTKIYETEDIIDLFTNNRQLLILSFLFIFTLLYGMNLY